MMRYRSACPSLQWENAFCTRNDRILRSRATPRRLDGEFACRLGQQVFLFHFGPEFRVRDQVVLNQVVCDNVDSKFVGRAVCAAILAPLDFLRLLERIPCKLPRSIGGWIGRAGGRQ